MKRYGTIVILGLFFVSCASSEQGKNNKDGNDTSSHSKAQPAATAGADYLQVRGDSVLIPSFEIALQLSDKANEKLMHSKETVIVAAWFAGQPKDTSSREYAESGEMFIRSYQVELSNSRTARFENIQFSKTLYDLLANKDIQVLINVFSGRRSLPDNLLDCGIVSDKISAVKNRTIIISGKLIGEADSSIIR